jgi:predicted RNA binding protein YcfA (HicA-like mRNA interferase family)
VNQVGSHKQFRHPKLGRVTVVHPKRDFAIATLEVLKSNQESS